jgi:hypothetical protein
MVESDSLGYGWNSSTKVGPVDRINQLTEARHLMKVPNDEYARQTHLSGSPAATKFDLAYGFFVNRGDYNLSASASMVRTLNPSTCQWKAA